MKYAVAFIVLGACAGTYGMLMSNDVGKGVGLWVATSFIILGVAYGMRKPGLLGKKRDGTMQIYQRLLLGPYFGLTWFLWQMLRWCSRKPSVQKVCDDLYIGRRLLAKELLDEPKFDHYVDLTAEMEDPEQIRLMPGYRCLPILDASTPDRRELRATLEAVKDGTTFIHCAQGHGRTGMVALALLHFRRRVLNLDEGLALLQKVRPGVALNFEQRRFLQSFIDESDSLRA